MIPWRYSLDVSDVWKSANLTFDQQKAEIVNRLKRHVWYFENEELREEVVPGIAAATNVYEFDKWWDILYDLADEDRVWVATF
jgi:hypothetical protein